MAYGQLEMWCWKSLYHRNHQVLQIKNWFNMWLSRFNKMMEKILVMLLDLKVCLQVYCKQHTQKMTYSVGTWKLLSNSARNCHQQLREGFNIPFCSFILLTDLNENINQHLDWHLFVNFRFFLGWLGIEEFGKIHQKHSVRIYWLHENLP